MTTLEHLPPHLPPPTCNIEQHTRQERLKFFFIAAFFGLFGGLSGASVLLGWIWPGFGGGDTWGFSAYHATQTVNPLDGRVQEDSAARIVRVFKEATVVGGAAYFNDKNNVGTAAALSTDGWLVMYLPGFDGTAKNWQTLSSEGKVVPVEKVLFDRASGLLYLKVAAQDRVVAFADALQTGDDVFAYENKVWSQASVEQTTASLGGLSHLDSAPAEGYTLTRSFAEGAPLFSRQGRFVGFVVKDNLVMPGQLFGPIVTSILTGQGAVYPTLGAEGWFDEDQPIVIDGQRVPGFLVNKVVGKNSVLKRGDVIEEVNGQIVHPTILWHTIYNETTIKATVRRANKNIVLTLPVQTISNP